ncbi:MAG: serpin family protein [Elainella sp.]
MLNSVKFLGLLGLALALLGGARLASQASPQPISLPFSNLTSATHPVELPNDSDNNSAMVNAATPFASNPQSVSSVDPRLTAANSRFGFKLFGQLLNADQNQNILVSPTSVALALSMLYNGAAGQTQQAMAAGLEIQDLSLVELNQANAALAASLQAADPSVQLKIANSLWGRQDVTFKPDFLQRNREFYNAEITSLDFADPNSVGQINDWASQNTAGKIPEIVDRLDPQQVLFLLNAVYFKGNWTTQFDPAQTQNQPFYLLDGSQKQHPLMSQRGRYRYYETDQFQAISLPYGNRRLSMYVFLPRPNSSLSALTSSLSAASWETWMGQFRSREGQIQLPKFSFEYETSLNAALQALGMAPMFQAADFANLSDLDTEVDQVKHKTFIEVNEVGTEAAAVTSIGVRTTSIDPTPPFQMRVDRPFFCAIRDDETGTILFMGTVVNPN